MSEFNPQEHIMKLKGKDYLQVMWRLVWFRSEHPDWCIDTNVVEVDGEHAIFKALIADENGVQKSSGYGSESKRDFVDFIEKAETKAVGRALAMVGFGTQFVGDEFDEGERIVDSPVKPVHMPDIPKAETPAQIETVAPQTPTGMLYEFLNKYHITQEDFLRKRKAMIDAKLIPDIPSKQMTVKDAEKMIEVIKFNFRIGEQA